MKKLRPAFLLAYVTVVLAHCARPDASANPPTATARPTAPPTPPPAATALTVSSPAVTEPLAQGADAPRFAGTAHDGTRVEVAGTSRPKVLVVYFYPRDETPGCTVEAQQFRDQYAQLQAAGADIVGVSTDGADAHRGFAAHHQLPFPLLPDPEGTLASAFGVTVSSGYARRMTFLIGKDNHIARAWPTVTPNGHAAEVLAAVNTLRTP